MTSKSHTVPRELPALSPDMPAHEAAVALIRGGLHVVPILHDGKRPYMPAWQDLAWSEDEARAHWLAHPHDGVGVIVRDGLVVLDADSPEAIDWLTEIGVDWATTPHTISGGGGRHVFYQDPGLGWNKTALHFDGVTLDLITAGTEGKGAQVVVHHTHPETGERYRVNVAGPIPAMPLTVAAEIHSRLTGPKFITPQNGHYAGNGHTVGEARRTYEEKLPIPEGSRNDTLYRIGCYLRGQKGYDKEQITEVLLRVNTEQCVPPLPDEEVRTVAAQASKYPLPEVMPPMAPARPGRPPVDLTEFPHNDRGNAERVAAVYGDDFIYIEDEDQWVTWDGTRWVREASPTPSPIYRAVGDVADIYYKYGADLARQGRRKRGKKIMEWATSWGNDSRINSTIRALRHVCAYIVRDGERVRARFDHFDDAPHLLAFENGVVDLRTGELRPGRRDDFITKSVRRNYNPDAECPTWLKVIDDLCSYKVDGEWVVDEELREYLSRAIGYSITGSVDEKHFFVVIGPTNTGKTKFLEALRGALGEYGAATRMNTLLSDGSENERERELFKVRSARLVTAPENSRADVFDEALIKTVVGGDTTSTRGLFHEAKDTKFHFKLWMGVNGLAYMNPDDDALWETRLRLIPTERQWSREDAIPDLGDRLEAEAEGILAWAVRQAVKYYAEGLPEEPARMRERRNLERRRHDRLAMFADEMLEFVDIGQRPAEQTAAFAIYTKFKEWLTENGYRKAPTSRTFYEEFEEKFAQQILVKMVNNRRMWEGVVFWQHPGVEGLDFTEGQNP